MMNEIEMKNLVKEKYAAIANQDKVQNSTSCCGATTSCCGDDVYNIMSDDYTTMEGYNPEADLGLGCGLPTEYAGIKAGNTVIDLGSGAGNDAFVAAKLTGETGKVIGIDFTEAMINRARENATKIKAVNVEFRQGDIEDMPVGANIADVVISNCVLNLVPNKENVFREINRVLKPGGHFSISDIVLQGELPEKWKSIAEFYAGCISGAIQMDDYLNLIQLAGFEQVTLQKNKPIIIPDDILSQYLDDAEMMDFKQSKTKITSITVFAIKPTGAEKPCCQPGSGCC